MGNICLPQQKKSTVEVITGCGVRTQLTLFEQINDANRLEKWISVFQISEEDMNPHHCELSYKVANKMVFKNLVIDYTTYPSFGTDIQWEIFPQLTEEMKTSAIRLFYLISEMNGLYFAPQLPYFTIILLHYYSEEIVYSIISSILGNGELRKRFFILNQRYQESFIEQVNEINQRLGNPVNKSFSTQHSSIYGYIVRSWMNSVFLTSLQPFQFARLFDAYIEVGIWLFPAFYVTFLNRYAGELLPLLNEENEEDNCFIVQSHVKDLTDDELELLLLNSIYLTTSFQNEDQEIQDRMTMMIKRIDEGEDIMNICKYHLYYVMGPSRLLTSSLCKEIMKILPVRVQSQDPHLLYTSIIHGYHLTHLLEKASFYKPTLLLCQIEHSGNLIGFYREDRWSHRRDAHGSSDSILLLIEFYSRHGEIETRIKKWDGGRMISDQFIDGVSHPTKYVYARSPGNYLMIGAGGKKGISFYSSEDYLKASSHSSDVFQNPPLCDKEFFSISNVELFHFVSPGSNYNVSFKQTKYHTG